MDSISREESVAVLEKMGVHIPPTSKLSKDAVEQRLKRALKAAQVIRLSEQDTNTINTLDVATYPIWPKSASVLAAIRSHLFNIEERFSLATELKFLPTDTDDPQRDTFVELRRLFAILAMGWEEGTKCIAIQDGKTNGLTTCMRMVEVRKVSGETPAIVVFHKTVTGPSAIPEEWTAEKLIENEDVLRVVATDLEHKLLLKLLSMNTKHVSSISDTTTAGAPDDADDETNPGRRTSAEQTFKISALFPVGPLPFEDIGELNKDEGCAVCGETKARKCAGCHVVSYCGPACQKADWPTHKPQCLNLSLKNAKWYKVAYADTLGGMPYMTNMSRFGHRSGLFGRTSTPDDPPLEDAGDGERVFPIKLQSTGPTSVMPHIMIYDRKQTFTGFWEGKAQGTKKQKKSSADEGEEDEGETYDKFLKEMAKYVPKYGGWKMYRFAKRTGEKELSICLDREPPNVRW